MSVGTHRVLVNLTWLVPGVVGGSEVSLTDALRAVLDDPPPDLELHQAVLEPFLDSHPDLAAAFPHSVLGLDGSSKPRRVLAEQTWLAREARRVGASVVHHAGGVVPLVHPGRVVLTIQDLQPLDLPDNFSLAKRTYIRTMAGRSARAASVVCVPSEFSRRRVVDLLGVPSERVAVVPWSPRLPRPLEPSPAVPSPAVPSPAVPSPAVPRSRPPEVPAGPYLLYPAITYPHKNHLVLLEAFARVAAEDPSVTLVLTGGAGASEDQVLARIARPDLQGRVQRPGRVAAPVLEALYGDAVAVVVPSRYEGFGLPVLEAFARDVPVVASSAGSLPEVARSEDLVDPDDVTAWAKAVQCVLSLSPEERSRRIVAGRALLATFSPEATAAGLLRSYRRAAPDPP